MTRTLSFTLIALLLILSDPPSRSGLSKYKAVEAYEIRHAILMVPKHSPDGQVCEVGIERLHYLPSGTVNLEAGLSRQTVNEIVDELAPPSERGPGSDLMGTGRMLETGGGAITETYDYKNVTVILTSRDCRNCKEGILVATIFWKNRGCE